MTKRLSRLFNRALDEAAVSIRRLAEECGYHPITFLKYRTGDREPTPEAALKLAKVLRRRSQRLAKLADQLEAQAKSEKEGGRG